MLRYRNDDRLVIRRSIDRRDTVEPRCEALPANIGGEDPIDSRRVQALEELECSRIQRRRGRQ